ncbi:hypothetical protein AB0K51_30105 [Kitasatospora sp. NPDC049285]|uniref:hypothetical protein n=1 Tax=Kitasatospora sp. NPDC049285 TaxID=3157096 RepID=UPI00343C0E09
MKHRTPQRSSIIGRTAGRLGVLSGACLAVLAVAAPAGAVPFSDHPGRGVAAFADRATTHASRVHPDQYEDSFTVHQLGTVFSVGANNRATAVSAGCSTPHPCRSIALSFQIVTMAGDDVRLNATNLGRAVNEQCPSCQTLAGAYQFIVSTAQPFRLSPGASGQLAAIHRRLDALGASHDPIPVVKQRADDLAAQVKAILDHEALTAPRAAGMSPLAKSGPSVTMHRHYDGAN